MNPITVKTSRLWYRTCVAFTGVNETLETFVSATATVLGGTLIQENRTEGYVADYFAEWEFPAIHSADRFRRTLDGFEPPFWRDDLTAWEVIITQLYCKLLQQSLTTWEEDQADMKGKTWTA